MTLHREDSPACRFHLDKKASHDQGIKAQSIPLERGGRQSGKSKSKRVIFFQNELGGPKKLPHSLTYFLDKGNNSYGLTILVQMLLRSRLHVSAFLCPSDRSKYYGLQRVVYFVPTK